MNEKKKLVPKLRFPEFRGVGGWDADGLGLVADFVNEKIELERVALENYVSTENILADFGGIDRASKLPTAGSVTRFQSNDILVSNIRPYLKKVWIADIEGGASNDVIVIRAKQRLLPQYLSALLKNDAFIDYVMTGAKGVKMPRGDIGSMKAYPALYPAKPEQQKIVDCLSSLDELIVAQARKVAALKTHKKGLMQQLFPREGETQPRLRFPEFRDAGTWEKKRLAKVCNVLQGYGFPEVLQGKREGKYPFCKVSDISRAVAENGGLLAKATNYVGDEELLKLRAKLIPKGATVFAKIGEALRLNRRAYVQKECLIDNNATGLQAIVGVADDYFVFLLSQLIDLNKHCGGAVPSVNKSTLEEIEVVVPGPDEQKRIAMCLASLDDVVTAQVQKLETLKTHKKGLMQQLFPSAEGVDA